MTYMLLWEYEFFTYIRLLTRRTYKAVETLYNVLNIVTYATVKFMSIILHRTLTGNRKKTAVTRNERRKPEIQKIG